MGALSGSLAVMTAAVGRLAEVGFPSAEFIEGAAVCSGTAVVTDDEPGRFIAEELGTVGIDTFYTEQPVVIESFAIERLCEMRFNGSFSGIVPELTGDFDLLEAARMLADFTKKPVDRIYADIFYRTRAGTMRPYAVFDVGRLVATAFLDFVSAGSAVVGSVAVAPEYRGRALGLRAAAAAAATVGEAFLLCETALSGRYAEYGFVKSGDVYISRRTNERDV